MFSLTLALWLGGCGFLPGAIQVVDTASQFVPPDGVTDPALVQVGGFNMEWLWRLPEAGIVPRYTTDYQMVGRLMSDYDLDLMALEEINGADALELLELPEDYAWVVGETGWSQNIAFLYRSDLFEISDVRELHLPTNITPSKDPLVAQVRHKQGDLSFTFVGVHMNPYDDDEDALYRQAQQADLYAWLLDEVSQDIVIAGDFNDSIGGINTRYPSLDLLDSDPDYYITTRDTEVPTEVGHPTQIDHVVVSQGLYERYVDMGQQDACHVIEHDRIIPWRNYTGGYNDRQNISDHRPVWIHLRTGL